MAGTIEKAELDKQLAYRRICTKTALAKVLPELSASMRAMVKKIGSNNVSALHLMNVVSQFVETDYCFLLTYEKSGQIEGFLLAFYNPTLCTSSVDVLAMWSRPNVASKVKFEAMDRLTSWAKSKGATSILASVVRSPKTFYRFFYRDLGFKPIGLVLEAKL